MTKPEYLEENLRNFQNKITKILTTQDLPEKVKREIENKYREYAEILNTTLKKVNLSAYTKRYGQYHDEAMWQSEELADKMYQQECEIKAAELKQTIGNIEAREDLNSEKKEYQFMDSCYATVHRQEIDGRGVSYGEAISENVAEKMANCRKTMEYIFSQNFIDERRIQEYREQVSELIEGVRRKMPETIDKEMLQNAQISVQKLEEAYQQYQQEKEKIEQKPMTLEDRREDFTSSLAATEEVKQKLAMVEKKAGERETTPEKEKEEKGNEMLSTDIII